MTTAAALLSFTSVLSIAESICVYCLFVLFCSSFFVLSRVISTFSCFTSVTLSLLVFLIVSIMISAVILLASSVRCIPSFSIRRRDSSIFVSRAILLGNVVSRYVLNLVVSRSWSRLLIVYLGVIWATTMYLVSSRSSFFCYSQVFADAFCCQFSLFYVVGSNHYHCCGVSLCGFIVYFNYFHRVFYVYCFYLLTFYSSGSFQLVMGPSCVWIADQSYVCCRFCTLSGCIFILFFSNVVHLARSSFFSFAIIVLELFRILFVSSSFFYRFLSSSIFFCCSLFFCVSSCSCSCRFCSCFLFSFLCSLAFWLFSSSLLFSYVIFSLSLFSWAFSCFSSLFRCFSFRRASFVWVSCLIFCVFPLFFCFPAVFLFLAFVANRFLSLDHVHA